MNIVKIKRPNGEIEIKDISAKFPVITQATFDKLVAVNRAAGFEILGFVEGGIAQPVVARSSASFSNSRRTIAAILGGSHDENDDTSVSAMRGGY